MSQPEPVWILVGFGVGLALLLLFFMMGAGPRRKPKANPTWLAIWEEVAKRLGGKLFLSDEGDFRVRFKWSGRDAALTEDSKVVFKIEGVDFLKPELWLAATKSDDQYRFLKTDHPFVTPAVQKLLDDLAEIGGRELGIDRRIRIAGNPTKTVKDLVLFTVLCLQLAQHAKLFAEKDDRVSVVESKATGLGECQICGASLEGTLVRCARCSTPHHADCWDYAGVCSTYGCGGKTFVA